MASIIERIDLGGASNLIGVLISLAAPGPLFQPFLRMAWLSEESSSSFVRANTQAYGKTEVQSEWGICSFGVS